MIFISGYPDRVPRFYLQPGVALLQKPFTSSQLLDALGGLFGE